MNQPMTNSVVELADLLRNHLHDVLFKEASNDKYINLYYADHYWVAFEKSAFRLCNIYSGAMLLPMKIAGTPFPIVVASFEQERLPVVVKGLDCMKWSDRERVYIINDDGNTLKYYKWHERETHALLTLPDIIHS